MILRLLSASLRRRFRQLLLMGVAVLVAAATVGALAAFAARARAGLGDQLAAFGPNLAVRPQVGGPAALPPSAAAAVRGLPGVAAAAAVADVTSHPAAVPPELRPLLAAARAADLAVWAVEPELLDLHPAWRLEGRWPAPGQVAVSAEAAPRLASALPPGALAGTLSDGGAAVAAVLLPLAAGTAGGSPGVDRIEVRADRERLGAVAAAVERAVPGAEARPLLRVTRAERELVHRITLLLAAAAVVACLLALISVGAATAALVDQRRVEAGLLLALGMSGRRVAGLFAAEFLAAALLAGLAGEAMGQLAGGHLAAGVLGPGVVGASSAWGLAAAPAAAVAVAGLAITTALRRVGRTDPARVLRGE